MKWKQAIKTIEHALNRGEKVQVIYHRKWARNTNEMDKWGLVYGVNEYDWNGQRCKGITINDNSLDEGNFIVDYVVVNDGRISYYLG